jgi:hypothetical protein
MSMENQHRQIKGYRDLSQNEVDQMNAVKQIGETLGGVIASMRATPSLDQRWVSIAETHLQQGIMAAVRAIAQPTTF